MSDAGISIRMIRQYDPELDRARPLLLAEKALMLAMADEREDVPFGVKLTDAMTYLKRAIH